jgi:hypothetical protein
MARRVLAVLFPLILCAPGVALASDSELTRSFTEIQLGGGLLSGSPGFGPLAQVQARFALWRTIGLGVYAAGAYTGPDGVKAVVPVCGRLNLSLPFWKSVEPVLGVGAGGYTYFLHSQYGGGSKNQTEFGVHAALSILFPHKRNGFGIETCLHLTADPQSSDSYHGFVTLAGTYLIR